MRGGNIAAALESEIGEAQVVRQEDHDIGFSRGRGAGRERDQSNSKNQGKDEGDGRCFRAHGG
jgi:hypothetical protein